MVRRTFFNRQRRQWMAKYFNGLSLLSAAGIVSETFVKLGSAYRTALVCVLFGSFAFGLFFAKANRSGQNLEDDPQ